MEIHYKGYIVVVTAGADSKFKWRPTCIILSEGARTLIKDLEWVLDYDTHDQAERVGLLVSRKWIDQFDDG